MAKNTKNGREKICVVGLGYVGLPLAAALCGARFEVVGFDRDRKKISALTKGLDPTGELSAAELAQLKRANFSAGIRAARGASVFIIAAPTPVRNDDKRPDLSALLAACESVGGALQPGGLVVVESTVYPGVTEKMCAPLLESVSGLKYNRDFFCGYSPERINPGDKTRRFADIVKLTAGSTPAAAARVDAVYKKIVKAGTFRAASIAVAEAAKVMENTQRDVNIAVINEFALICDSLNLNTEDVLAAAATKWNFLPFRPGLVGGHCIGVDPYYLAHQSRAYGYAPRLVPVARDINDGMGRFVAARAVELLQKRRGKAEGARVLVMGLSFKENCADCRNSRVVDIVADLQNAGCRVRVCDPRVPPQEARALPGMARISFSTNAAAALRAPADAVIFAVAHDEFKNLRPPEKAIVLDVKGVVKTADWRL